MLTGYNDRMKEVQATEAKAHLAELLSLVERGESIAITRYGQRIAHLVPAETQDQSLREEMIRRFRDKRALWSKSRLLDQDILDLRHEGHER